MSGKWRQHEVNKLKMNVQRYIESESIDVETMLIGDWGQRGTEKWLKLGHGINRSTQSVRTKVFYLYGKREARAVVDHGKNHDRHRQFSLGEDSRLVVALEEAKAIRGNKVVDGIKISWQKISEKVRTRTGPSCRQRWMTYLSKQPGFMAFPFGFGKRHVWKMAKLVRDYVISKGIKDFIDIPWEDVILKTGVPLLPHEIRKKFEAHLGEHFKSSLRYTFQRKIHQLGRVLSIRTIPAGVKHWSQTH